MREKPSPAQRVTALLIGSAALYAIWSWSPVPPAGDVGVAASAEEAVRMPPGSRFLVEGTLLVAPGDSAWQGYPVYQRADRTKDQTGDPELRIRHERRPAVTVRTSAGDLQLPAGSYSLRHAPRVPAERWYRQ